MGLLLAVVGIYGVVAYAVSQQTQDIGIRMALGAQQETVKRHFVGQALVLVAVGIVVGLVAAFGLTRLMSSLLFGVTALDPTTYVAVSAFLFAAAVFASYLPARRAATVSPLEALRAQ